MARDLTRWGLTQAVIARKCGTSQATVSEIISGKRIDTSYAVGKKIEALHARLKLKMAR